MNGGNLLALTLREPWASAVVYGGKDVENRTWYTPYRGDFALHAGKSIDPLAGDVGGALRARVTRGCVVALVTLHDVVRDSTSSWAREDHYHWVIGNVRPLAVPIPCIGRLSLFKLPLHVETAVLEALATNVGE